MAHFSINLFDNSLKRTTSFNPEVQVKKLKESGKAIPEIFMCCGTEDFLIKCNRDMHEYLNNLGISHTYCESKGIHDIPFWNEYTIKYIDLMFADEK